jgi:pimeloyl-ACP methyl ester carboxylesterase
MIGAARLGFDPALPISAIIALGAVTLLALGFYVWRGGGAPILRGFGVAFVLLGLMQLQWVREQRPDDDLWLAGFSFGAYVSLRANDTVLPEALISIAPPAGRWDFDKIATPVCPWLVIQGENDEIVDPQAVYAWIDTLKRKPELVRMPDTSHFFHRKLIDLRGALQHGVKHWLPVA